MRRAVKTADAPAAIGPYSQGVQAGGFLFVSGQIPLDPETGLGVGDTIEVQAQRSLDNVRAVVEAAGASLSDVVKTTVYLADMNDFSAVNGVYATYFDGDPPARAAVEVARLPKDVRIEIEAIAVMPSDAD